MLYHRNKFLRTQRFQSTTLEHSFMYLCIRNSRNETTTVARRQVLVQNNIEMLCFNTSFCFAFAGGGRTADQIEDSTRKEVCGDSISEPAKTAHRLLGLAMLALGRHFL